MSHAKWLFLSFQAEAGIQSPDSIFYWEERAWTPASAGVTKEIYMSRVT